MLRLSREGKTPFCLGTIEKLHSKAVQAENCVNRTDKLSPKLQMGSELELQPTFALDGNSCIHHSIQISIETWISHRLYSFCKCFNYYAMILFCRDCNAKAKAPWKPHFKSSFPRPYFKTSKAGLGLRLMVSDRFYFFSMLLHALF